MQILQNEQSWIELTWLLNLKLFDHVETKGWLMPVYVIDHELNNLLIIMIRIHTMNLHAWILFPVSCKKVLPLTYRIDQNQILSSSST